MHTQCTAKATFITTSQDNLHFFKLNFTDLCLHYLNGRFIFILFKEPNLYCIHYVYFKNVDLISFFCNTRFNNLIAFKTLKVCQMMSLR